MKRFSEWASDKTYYVAWTPFQDEAVVAISITSKEDALKLATDATVFNVQVVTEEPMKYSEINRFLDELSDMETRGKSFKFIHGRGVNSKIFSTI
jgi:hypothetical protein